MGIKIIFFFLDGVGLGINNPEINPFVQAKLPNLEQLLDGKPFLANTAPYLGNKASLLALDACLGISGLPQSATGQATLLTGKNIPGLLGYHYGPKPTPDIAYYLKNGNLFSKLRSLGKNSALINAYPPRYFEAIESGRRIYSAIPLAVTSAGYSLLTMTDLVRGEALAADFTAEGWHEHLGLSNIPILTPQQAGERFAYLANGLDLTFFEYWLSDVVGHKQDMKNARLVLEALDQVLGALITNWDDGLIILTSDHGNIEDLSTRRHTSNPVPALLIGPRKIRNLICDNLNNLSDITPTIIELMTGKHDL